jgi:hypothetical protein
LVPVPWVAAEEPYCRRTSNRLSVIRARMTRPRWSALHGLRAAAVSTLIFCPKKDTEAGIGTSYSLVIATS